MSYAFRQAREVTGGIAEGIQGAGRALGSAASSAFATVRNVTGDTYDAIGRAAQKVGNTVEAVLQNPKALAAVAISIAFPTAAPAIGEWILGAELAASVGAAGTAAVGNMCLNTAMNGGDVGQAVKTTALQYAGNIGSQKLTEIVRNADIVPDAFAKNVGTTTTYAAIQAAQGKDPTVALLTGGANACAQLLVQEVPGFSEMPPQAQAAITKATASVLQGKSGGAINAAIDYATNFVKDEYKTYKEANDNGFGYNPDTWRDAKSIGITNPQDYQYAKTIGADNPYDLQIGKAIGARDNFDLTLAKDIGLSTSEDFNYAKQLGVNNKEDFSLAKDIGAQNSLDIDFAKQLGIDTSRDFNYARNLGVNNADDFNFAKSVNAADATDLNIAKEYGIGDKETLSEYSDFLRRGQERSSEITVAGEDGTEMTIDNEGNLRKYTYVGYDGKPIDITDEVTNVASRANGYQIRGDDGSILNINPDGTVSAIDAPDDPMAPGSNRPSSYAKLLGIAQQNRAATIASERGGVNQATQEAAARMRASPNNRTGYQVTGRDIAGILPLFMGEETIYPTAQEGEEESPLAKVQTPEDADLNYLADMGGRPNYLAGLDDGSATRGSEVQPGKDAGAASRGAVFGPPVGTGGGGAGYDRYTTSGPMEPFGGGAGYGRSSMSDIYKILQSQGASQPGVTSDLLQSLRAAGLEDQSDAETRRLLAAQGPVAIGRLPAPRTSQVPTVPVSQPALPALADTALANVAAPSVDPLKQLQQYAGLASTTGADTINSLLKYILAPSTMPKGTEAYKDMFGNIRTR